MKTRVGSRSPPSSGSTNPSPGASLISRSSVSFIAASVLGSPVHTCLQLVNVRVAMKISLTPRTTEFFVLFASAGENALEVARLVERRFREHPNSGVTQEQVKAAETAGDAITRDLIVLLNTQYLTPFDREDIYQLATEIDDVVDFLEEASDLLGLYGVEMPTRHAVEQCAIIVKAVEQLAIACDNLKGMRASSRRSSS